VLVAGVYPGALCILLSVRFYDEVNVPAACMCSYSGLVFCFHFAVSLLCNCTTVKLCL
jgi:hypothetical protein